MRIRREPTPAARAAMTNSRLAEDDDPAVGDGASPVHCSTAAMTTVTSSRLAPTIETRAMDNKRMGNDSTASVKRIRIDLTGRGIVVSRPNGSPNRRRRSPTKPATEPTVTPMSVARRLAIIPTVSDVRAP